MFRVCWINVLVSQNKDQHPMMLFQCLAISLSYYATVNLPQRQWTVYMESKGVQQPRPLFLNAFSRETIIICVLSTLVHVPVSRIISLFCLRDPGSLLLSSIISSRHYRQHSFCLQSPTSRSNLWPSVGLKLGQWHNIEPADVETTGVECPVSEMAPVCRHVLEC